MTTVRQPISRLPVVTVIGDSLIPVLENPGMENARTVTISGENLAGQISANAQVILTEVEGVRDETLGYRNETFDARDATIIAKDAAQAAAGDAENAATDSVTAFTSFNKRYLLPATSDPTLDDEGEPLLTGAMYWNTSNNELRIYGGVSWSAYSPASIVSGEASSTAFDAAGLTYTDAEDVQEAIVDHDAELVLIVAALATDAGDLATHVANTSNPHGVTKTQVGLSAVLNEAQLSQGRMSETIYAASWMPTVTNGAGRSYEELATNDIISDSLDFSTSTQEFATTIWCPPKKYNGGTITFQAYVRLPGASSTQTVDLAISARFIRNDDPVDGALGTPVAVTDTFLAAGDLHVTPESAAITPAGTYAAGCKLMLKLQRNVSSDNAAGDAKVEAITIFWTANASTDT